MSGAWTDLVYLVGAVMIAVGIKFLGKPKTAATGNFISAGGMLLAVLVTLTHSGLQWPVVIAGLAVGTALGVLMATRVQMTEMPELVALFNGFGGLASVLVGWAALLDVGSISADALTPFAAATVASGLVGSVTFWGSLVAFVKLRELYKKNLVLPGHIWINLGLLAASLVVGLVITGAPGLPVGFLMYGLLVVFSSLLGVLLVTPIGGADMPVVIALLNSYSGIAAAATGFVLNNTILMIAGALVGASGIILTQIMCKAMNRSLMNVMMGAIAASSDNVPTADEVYGGKIKATSADEVAMILDGAQRVVIVPGYGMAVSQAQHAVRDLTNLLESRGTTVEFGIHPVAGRMPGHMNVLLAESDIPYDKLLEMDSINPTFGQTDVVIVLGANDVVNPVARTDPSSPIAGMPILNVDEARTVVVVKRGLSPGYAGIPNPLFAAQNTLMYFEDGKKAMLDVIAALKAA